MPAISFDALVDQAITAHSEPRAALGELMARYHSDSQARLAINRWLASRLEDELERRTHA